MTNTTITMTTTTTTTMTTMSMEMEKYRSGREVTAGGGGAGLLPGIDKNADDSNMNVRKRATNRAKTAANNKTKTGVRGKGGGLDTNLR